MQTDPDTRSLEGSESIHFAGFALDVIGCTLTAANGQDVPLRRAEFALLLAFLRSPGRVLSRDHLLNAVAGRPSAPYDRSIDVLVSRLRRKTESATGAPRLIVTMPGLGYKFATRPQVVQISPQNRPYVGIDLHRSSPDKSSLVVLPFRNLGGDRGQDYFAEGITEEITTALSRIPSLSVIAQLSTFAARGRSADVIQLGRELGARYMLEGSVRKVGDRVRIGVQLIDSTSSAHLWADRFDHHLTDILETQDELTRSVVGAIDTKLRQFELERSVQRSDGALRAADLVLRGQWAQKRSYRAGLAESRRLLQRAVAIDPNYALARALLADCNFTMALQLLRMPSRSELGGYVRMARDAVEDARDDPEVLIPAAHVIGLAANPDEGFALLDRALNLNPYSTDGWAVSGLAHAHEGNIATALDYLERSTRLNPLHRQVPSQGSAFVVADIWVGRYEQALIWSERASRDVPGAYTNLRTSAALLGLLGRTEEARNALSQLLTMVPSLTFSRVRHQIEIIQRISPFRKTEFHRAVYEGLRMAGLPE
jgi:TolB-like protein